MLKNPFSFYDFLGYLFPGLLFVMFTKMILSIDEPLTISAIFRAGNLGSFELSDTVPYTVISYISGHFISYFSSLTIEPFLVWSYGYPSTFLLKDNSDKNFFEENKRLGKSWTIFWKIIVCLFILPICLASLFFGKLLKFRFYVLKPLDDYLVKGITSKLKLLVKDLGLSDLQEGKDVHRIVMHYCYEHYNNHIPKYDNYVALYGFLRCLSFIFNGIFIFFLVIESKTISFNKDIDYYAIIFLAILFCIVYVFYLGFVKFYRRYTLENFMSILVDDKIKNISTT